MLFLLRSWILLCAVITATGWIASALRQLNTVSYVVACVASAAIIAVASPRQKVRLAPLKRRFRQPLPALYLILSALSILGGFLYQPTNVDAYSYRIPRVLHWLAEGRWHWIHTSDIRLNVVATGFDWLSAPVLLLTKSDRLICLLNAVSFLLLPGAIFLALSRLGVRPRVAAAWMWILPAGFCYFMQAGSLANDMYAAVFTLGAIGFALRARERREWADFWSSLLALALATGAKQTNLPFALPWLIAVAPALRLGVSRPFASTLVVLLAALSSVLPTSVLNVLHGRPWQGFTPGRDFTPANPVWGIVGNAAWITISNLNPPIVPWAGKWNQARAAFIESDYGAPFRSFEAFGYLHRAASEQYAGLGCTVTILLLLSWAAGRALGRRKRDWTSQRAVRAAIWLGFLVFLAKVGVNQCPRYLAPWYPFLAASLLLAPGQSILIRRRWWKLLAGAVLVAAIGLTVLSRQRPLFPAQTLLRMAKARLGETGPLQKVFNSYAFAETVRTELDPFLAHLPPDERVVGYAIRFGEKEPFFWKPYFTRRVLRIINSDPPEAVRALPLKYIIVGPTALRTEHDFVVIHEAPSPRWGISSIEEWLRVYDAELVATGEYLLGPEGPREKLYLTRLRR